MHAHTFPDKIGARDLDRAMTFRLWHERACRLANALLGLGLGKGDRVCVLAYNCVEWLEIYAATAMAGLVAVPINFRLVGAEIRYIVENCEAQRAHRPGRVARHRSRRSAPICRCRPANFIVFGRRPARPATAPTRNADPRRAIAPPASRSTADDPWTLMYTSGTTGKPKGAIRSHRGGAMLSLVTEIELGLSARATRRCWSCRCATPIRSISSARSPIAARACTVYNRKSFDPEHLVRTLAEGGATFTSLVPTHYIMMLGLLRRRRARDTMSTRVTKLMISSAPARRDTKLAIMEYFKNSGLFELYGSTEAGWVTMLHPGRAVHQARLGRPRMHRLASDPPARCGRQRRAATAKLASSTPATLTRSTATGSCRKRRARLSAATIARSATWPAATRTATSIWSTARAT